MKFIDSIEIFVHAGKGGNGLVSFKSAKGKPKLGPDGGDGGTGGSVYLEGTSRLNTLNNLRYRAIYNAEDGVRGGANTRRGRNGEDLIVPVPLGTVAIDKTTGEKLGELLEEGEHLLVAKGGRHGLGNIHWVSSTHQTPEESRPGEPGEDRELELELKLLADVGLAGFPNAGKSTLLSVVSAARPKIADYPFTTLVPNLGVVEVGGPGQYGAQAIVVADVPGLIEGASAGRGLGLQFLKHLERTSLVAYVIDAADYERAPVEALAILEKELQSFSPELAAKRAVVILNKIDLLDAETLAEVRRSIESYGMKDILQVSAATVQGIVELKRRLYDLVEVEKSRCAAAPTAVDTTLPSPAALSTVTGGSAEHVESH